MTCPERLDSKASHVKATWGSRCNKVLYVSDYLNTTFPTINITVDHGRKYLTAKTMAAFDYIYKHHLNDADWFMKADDDTYVIMENLRYFLSEQDTNKPLLFGSHFMLGTAMGSMSGGAGYVVSKEALRRYGKRSPDVCKRVLHHEDVDWAHCMQELNVTPGDSRDSHGRSRFHPLDANDYIHGKFHKWLQTMRYGVQKV